MLQNPRACTGFGRPSRSGMYGPTFAFVDARVPGDDVPFCSAAATLLLFPNVDSFVAQHNERRLHFGSELRGRFNLVDVVTSCTEGGAGSYLVNCRNRS